MTSDASEGQPGAEQLVVAGVDGSAPSVAALKWAANYTRGCGGTLWAVMVWHFPSAVGPAPPGIAPESVSDEVRQEIDERLAAAVEAAAPDTEVHQRIAYGHPAEALINVSREADLLVVGNRGHGAFTAMLLGSVSMQCVTHAHCPVVVVRTKP